MRIGLMVPALTFSGDAVSRDVIGMYHAIAGMGHEPIVFAWMQQESQGLTLATYDAALELTPDDLLIYHFCTGDQKALEVMRAVKCRKAMKYHNVTPSHYFEGYSPEYVEATKQARAMLPLFVKIPGMNGMADSSFNRDEMAAFGMKNIHVVPPFHQTGDLLKAPAVQVPHEGIHVLTVGRIAPNKGLEDSINAFVHAAATSPVSMHYSIVGGSDPRLAAYKEKLVDLIAENQNVRFIDKVSVDDLAALYRNADIYLTTSLHEGFCVPAVEAMAFGVPIVSSHWGRTAWNMW